MKVYQGQNIQSVLQGNPNESQFELEAGVYEGSIIFGPTLTDKYIYSNADSADATQIITKAGPYSIGILDGSHHISFSNLTFKNYNQLGSIVDIYGSDVTFSGCKLVGNVALGQHRGIAANGANISVIKTRITDCFLVGQDAQAICGWTGTRNLFIDGCYLEGGAQAIMIGGSDPADIFRIPTNVKVTNSTLTKNTAWYSMSTVPQIKTCLELKNCNNFYAFNNTFEYAGIAQGQGGYLIVLTPRNQSGRADFTTIQNVLIEHCVCSFGAGCVSMLAHDTNYPSGPLRNVTIRDCEFNEISHKNAFWRGSGRIFQFERGPQNVILEGISVKASLGATLNANAYFIGDAPQNLIMRDITWPRTTYDLKIDSAGMGIDALRKYCPNLIYENVTYN